MSAKVIRLLVSLIAVGLSTGLYAQKGVQNPGDLFTVSFSQEVVVGDKILPVGTWQMRWEDGTSRTPTLKVYRDDALNVMVLVTPIATEDNAKKEASEAVIEKIGAEYYLTQVWVKGERTGYAVSLPTATASFQHGDTQRTPAYFQSASRIPNAWFEGQARSHNAQGLGNPDDGHLKGIVLARTYFPQDIAVAQVQEIEAPALPDEVSEVVIAQVDVPAEPEALPAVAEEVTEEPAILEPQEEIAAIQENVQEEQPQVEIAEESPVIEEAPIEQPSELAAVSPPEEEPAAFEPEQSQQQEEVFDGALPATASNWLAFVVIGLGLIGMSLMVRRS